MMNFCKKLKFQKEEQLETNKKKAAAE